MRMHDLGHQRQGKIPIISVFLLLGLRLSISTEPGFEEAAHVAGEAGATEPPEGNSNGSSICDILPKSDLRILSPTSGSILLAGEIMIHLWSSAEPSKHVRYFVWLDNDEVYNDWAGIESPVFYANASVKLSFSELGDHMVNVIQTCSPSAFQQDNDSLHVQQASSRFKFVSATKTGRDFDGVIEENSATTRYFLSVVSVFRDEELYLAEWIEFHSCAGVDHFFLYNHNSSTDEYQVVLRPYIEAGLVTLDQASESILDSRGYAIHQAQLLTFSRAVKDHGSTSRWMAFIDVDEFLYAQAGVTLVSEDGTPKLAENPSLTDVLLAYSEFGAVVAHWILFGSSNHRINPRGFVIQNYEWREREVSPLFKVVAQPTRIKTCNNHNHDYIDGFFAVNEESEILVSNSSQNHPPMARVIRINHYRAKSSEHTASRIRRALKQDSFHRDDHDLNFTRMSSSAEHLERQWESESKLNEAQDTSAQRFLTCMTDGMRSRAINAWNAWIEWVTGTERNVIEFDLGEVIKLRAWVFGPSFTSFSAKIVLDGVDAGVMAFPQIQLNMFWSEGAFILPKLEPGIYSVSAFLCGDGRHTSDKLGFANVSSISVDLRVIIHDLDSGKTFRVAEDTVESSTVRARAQMEKGHSASVRAGSSSDSSVSHPGLGQLEQWLGLNAEQVQDILVELKSDSATSGGTGGGLPPVAMSFNSQSLLQDVYLRMHKLLYQKRLLPVGIKESTLADGVNDVWGHERGGPVVRVLVERFLQKVSTMIPEDSLCLEWGRHYSAGILNDICNCGLQAGYCEKSWSLQYGDCAEGFYPDRKEICADVTNFSRVLPPGTEFEVIICTQVFEHLKDPNTAIREIVKSLIPGGTLIFTVPFMEQHHQVRGQFGDYTRWTIAGARNLLETAGLEIQLLETGGNSMLATAAQMGFGAADFSLEELSEDTSFGYTHTLEPASANEPDHAPTNDLPASEAQYMGVYILATKPDTL